MRTPTPTEMVQHHIRCHRRAAQAVLRDLGSRLTLTNHAAQRMDAMGVPAAEVARIGRDAST